MEHLNLSFWLGLALAVPLSVVGNLLTPAIAQRWAKRSSESASRRLALLKQELQEAEALAAEPNKHQIFLLESVLSVSFIASFVGVFSGVLFALDSIGGNAFRLFSLLGQFVAVFGGVLVVKEVFVALRKSSRVRRIEQFRREVAARSGELGAVASDA